MDITIYPKKLSGTVSAIPSKSQAHRYLICAALAEGETSLVCEETNRDIEATADCLNAMGAHIRRTAEGYHIRPIKTVPRQAVLNCRDSGSTLRFLLPLAGALGIEAQFLMEGRLPQRPLSPLWEQMEEMGCQLSRPAPDRILCQGQLIPGTYKIPGNISSQYITGLLLSLIHLSGDSRIEITGQLESKPYVDLTLQCMNAFGVSILPACISGRQKLVSPGTLQVEGDWSNAAFFLTATALGNAVAVKGLSDNSLQGDKMILPLLETLSESSVIDAADIPDLIPILSIAAAKRGASFENIGRLRLKESDRVKTTLDMIRALGGTGQATKTTLTVFAGGITGGTVDAANDHRIAMAAAIAATVCKEPVTILGAHCVEKSYPNFWAEYARLGGNYEQYIR